MGNAADLLQAEDLVCRDTDGGRDGSTELAGAYTALASRAFETTINGIPQDSNLEAAKHDLQQNETGNNRT